MSTSYEKFEFNYDDKFLPVEEAVKTWCPPERHYSSQTLGRYASDGLDGVKLPTIRTSNTLHTTQAALAWFFSKATPVKRAYGAGVAAEANGNGTAGRVTVYAQTSPELLELLTAAIAELKGLKEAVGLLSIGLEDLKRTPRVPAETNGRPGSIDAL